MKKTQYQLKKNFISSLLLFTLAGSAHALTISDYEKKIKNSYSVSAVVDKLSRDSIEKNLRDFLSAARPSRFIGTPGHEKALTFIVDKLKEAKSGTFTKQEFTPDVVYAGNFYAEDFKKEIVAKVAPTDPLYSHWKGFTLSMIKTLDSVKKEKGYNLIWEKKGKEKADEIIILGANYDTILNDPKTMIVSSSGAMPGADNNGTGVAALLSMIELLDKLDLPKTVRIVFFDFENLGFLGSRAYLEKFAPQSIEKTAGFINLVMLGNDSKREDKEKKQNNMKVYFRKPEEKGSEKDLALVNLLTSAGKKVNSLVTFTPVGNSMNSSSHINFWEAGIPAVCFTQDWENDFNPRFNTPNDFVETLNMTTYTNSFRYITGGVLSWNYDIVK